MKHLITLCVLAGFSIALFAAPPTTKPDSAESLRAQIDQLRAENLRLKAELAQLKKDQLIEAFKLPKFDLAAPPAPGQQKPDNNWHNYKFNGRDVYVVPLRENETVPTKLQIHPVNSLDLIDDRLQAK